MTDKVQIHVKVSKRTRQRLKVLADEDGVSLMALAEALIERGLLQEELVRADPSALNLREKMDQRALRKFHRVGEYAERKPVFDFDD